MELRKVSKIGTILQKVVRVLIYVVGALTVPLYLFNLIGLAIGILYIIIFKNIWRFHGFFLALGIAFSTLFVQVGGVELTGMYPLYLVVTCGWGIMGLYFLVRLVNHLVEKYHPRTKTHPKLEKIIQTFKKPSKKGNFFIILGLILLPATFWSWVSIDFFVMFDNSPRLLWVHGPSTVNTSTEFEIAVQCWDRFERLSAQYDGTVEFSIESYNSTDFALLSAPIADVPLDYTFTGQFWPNDHAYTLDNGKDNGQHIFTANIHTEGIHYIKLIDSFTKNTYYSNPIHVANHSNQIYWGDIHTHSILSDGSGTAEHAYEYARNVAHIEFYALTDHGEILTINKNSLQKYISATDAAYTPGEFVNFYGMEWTQHKTGHYSCIFDKPVLPTSPILTYYEMKTPNDLWDALDNFTASTGSRALALPHHTVKASFMQDWSYLNPKYVKIAEVTSNHGDNLYDHHHPLSYRGYMVLPQIPQTVLQSRIPLEWDTESVYMHRVIVMTVIPVILLLIQMLTKRFNIL